MPLQEAAPRAAGSHGSTGICKVQRLLQAGCSARMSTGATWGWWVTSGHFSSLRQVDSMKTDYPIIIGGQNFG